MNLDGAEPANFDLDCLCFADWQWQQASWMFLVGCVPVATDRRAMGRLVPTPGRMTDQLLSLQLPSLFLPAYVAADLVGREEASL